MTRAVRIKGKICASWFPLVIRMAVGGVRAWHYSLAPPFAGKQYVGEVETAVHQKKKTTELADGQDPRRYAALCLQRYRKTQGPECDTTADTFR